MGSEMCIRDRIETARFFSKTFQGILIHALSRFGRRVIALCFYLVFGHIFAHTSQFLRLWGPRGGFSATDAGPLPSALHHGPWTRHPVPYRSSSRQQARGMDRHRSFCIRAVLSTQAPILCQRSNGGSDSHGHATADSSGSLAI